jgi:hypothetical protein
MAGITVAQLAQWRLKNVNLKIFEKNDKPAGTVSFIKRDRGSSGIEADVISSRCP